MSSLRLLSRAALLALILALTAAASVSAEICQDCGDGGSGGGGGGTTLPTPDTTITAGTFGDVNTKRPTETFKSNLDTVTYRCRFAQTGDNAWSETGAFACGSTGTAGTTTTWTADADMADGEYTFQVRACKAYSSTTKCDATPALRAVWIDTVAPSISVTGITDGARVSGLPTVGFDSDDGSSFHCATTAGAALANCGFGFTYPAGTPDGPQELRVKSIDGAGNESPVTTIHWTRDTVAPKIAFGGAGGLVNQRRPTITWAGQDADTVFQDTCWLEGPGDLWEIWNCPGGSWTPDADLADGSYVLQVRLIDRAGNSSQLEARDFTIDATAPALGDIAWDEAARRLTFTAEPGALECRFDGGAGFACGTTVDASRLGDGEHTLSVTLRDAAGNTATKEKAFRIGAAAQEQQQPDPQAPSQGAPTAPTAPSGGPSADTPTPSTTGSAPGGTTAKPVATPKPAAKKRCRTVTREVRGKTRKVRVCTKAKKKRRAAAVKRHA